MTRPLSFIVLACLLLLLIGGCQSARPYAAEPPRDAEGIERNHGYALLYATIESETRVDQVLMIKHPRSGVADVLRAIAEFAGEAKDALDTLVEHDASLGYDAHGLPFAEARARDLITKSTTNAIMFSSGRTFEFNILMTQHEALNYIVHLTKALREMDDDVDRLAALKKIEANAKLLHDRVMKLMQEIYADERMEATESSRSKSPCVAQRGRA